MKIAFFLCKIRLTTHRYIICYNQKKLRNADRIKDVYIVSHMQMLVEPFKFSLVSLNGRAEDYRQAARTLEMLHFFTEPLNFSIMQDLEQRSDIFLILFLNFSIMQC